jgi:hypothetical protein
MFTALFLSCGEKEGNYTVGQFVKDYIDMMCDRTAECNLDIEAFSNFVSAEDCKKTYREDMEKNDSDSIFKINAYDFDGIRVEFYEDSAKCSRVATDGISDVLEFNFDKAKAYLKCAKNSSCKYLEENSCYKENSFCESVPCTDIFNNKCKEGSDNILIKCYNNRVVEESCGSAYSFKCLNLNGVAECFESCSEENQTKCNDSENSIYKCTESVFQLLEDCGENNKCKTINNEADCIDSELICDTDGTKKCYNNDVYKCKDELYEMYTDCQVNEECMIRDGIPQCLVDVGNTGDTGNSGNTGDTGNTGNTGNTCTTDTDCGAGMICVTGGKCVKGCTANEDCTMYTGLKCNRKLARCTNIFASLQACGETKCPTGCCYADKGLTGVKCLTTAEPTKCGLCQQGDIYVPTDSKCAPAVCSTTTDNCPNLNNGSTNPKPSCFACKSGEFICQADTTSEGCSANLIINVKECISSGKQCVPGVNECCSGMPCVQGYCY